MGVGRVIATSEWRIKIVDVVQGAAVIDISPEETKRLGQSYNSGDGTYASCLDTWIAIQIEATNNGDDGLTRFLSPTAFQLADTDGSALNDIRTLSPPVPDLSGEYAAGASRAGWISFELPSNCGPGRRKHLLRRRSAPVPAVRDLRRCPLSDLDRRGRS